MKLNVFTRVFGLLTNPFSPPPSEETAPPTQDTIVMGPNMRRAIVLREIKATGKPSGVEIAQKKYEERRARMHVENKTS